MAEFKKIAKTSEIIDGEVMPFLFRWYRYSNLQH